MVELKNLTKKYDGKVAVDDLTLTMEKGHIYGLLGPNGAGKSTTMNLMTGFLGSSSGSVLIDGKDIFKNARDAKRMIGYLPEIPPVYNDMSVEEYLLFVCELKEIKKRKDRVSEMERVAKIANITDVMERQIRNLSKGYRQRVGFAQALIGSPLLIILDEPTVGLDPRQIQEFRNAILSLKEDHIVLISSHILAEVSELCDHIFILSQGKLIESSDALDLSTKFETTRRIIVTGIGDPDHARMVLSDTIPTIRNITTNALDENGQNQIVIEFTGDEDLRGQISSLLFENKFTILEIKEESQSLEDVFLQLTDNSEEEILEDTEETLEEEGGDDESNI